MANPEHLRIFKQGVKVWNRWRHSNWGEYLDLQGIRQENCNLAGVDFTRVNLKEASFTNSDLRMAFFAESDLVGADLGASLLGGADFYCANLKGSYLVGVDFRQTDFAGANLSRAFVGHTTFAANDLSETLGLDSVHHTGPSSLGIDTLYQSQGKIPESFLRGCGVPEDLIKLIPSLVTAEPFQFYKCFISHSTKDHLFCDRLYADLQSKGARCWYFPEDARWGRSVWGEIDKPIKIYDKLILVCSKQSLNSPAVLRELERALQREDAEGKHILFPIRIDNYLFDKWEHPRKTDVISKVVGDFRNWQDPAIYREKLDRLLRDLKASEE
ncbi:MAG: toll/interleukin-1 receptor domain-containing protein [Proteobacteria bacterium]|nr:toll/interleukin-1 receptor domain-containing protein [Pseudomonadota bacterium]MBU4604867.1 toll/interleukin-1 receptor domain-containing protein [Pseudomonadota bacterium]MCG2763290.1 toll/interleukin-1 receptor domain-containing protein [Desulfarculaceae bacterium]